MLQTCWGRRGDPATPSNPPDSPPQSRWARQLLILLPTSWFRQPALGAHAVDTGVRPSHWRMAVFSRDPAAARFDG